MVEILKKYISNVENRKDYTFKVFNFPQILKSIIMKKILFLFSLFMTLSCSSSDDSASSSDFNPPAWIQGTWKQDADIGVGNSFVFSKNDICFTMFSGGGQCQQGLIDLARKGGLIVKVTETITSTFYSAKTEYSNGQSVTYAFNKISNTAIEWTAVSGAEFIKQ